MIKHSCNTRSWDYEVVLTEYLVSALVKVNCFSDTLVYSYKINETPEFVEIWITGKGKYSPIIIYVKLDLIDYKFVGIEKDPKMNGRFYIILDKIYETVAN